MADIKIFDAIDKAFLKNAINEVKPGTEKLEGLEKLYSKGNQDIIPKIGDAAALGITTILGHEKSPSTESARKVEKYLEKGNSQEIANQLTDINAVNKELMSQQPNTDIQARLIANTIKEVQQPRDVIEDIEMDLKNNPHLSEDEKKNIIKKALQRFAEDQKPLNNLEATRPDRGTLGHSLDTANIYGILLRETFPEMSENEVSERVEAAKLHDYGKGMIRYRDLNSKVNFRENPEIGENKKTEINTHARKGSTALDRIGNKLEAQYAGEHHSQSDSLEFNLLKAADIYNALTGDRVYRTPKTPEKALEIMLIDNVYKKHEIPKEAYDILEKAVKEGKIKSPENYQSDLYDVYATEAGNAIEQRGIKLFDVDAAKASKLNTFQKALDSVQGFRVLQDLSKKTFGDASRRAKVKALMEVYKDKDWLMYNRLKNNYYTDNKSIDRLFKENIDEIIANQSQK